MEANSVSSGSVTRLAQSAGGQAQSVADIGNSETVEFGPYAADARLEIKCAAGSLTYSIAPVDLEVFVGDRAIDALMAEAVTPLTDSTGGTPGATLAAVENTSTGDRSAAINSNFASLNQQIEDLKEALVDAGLLTEYVAP